MKPKKKAKKRKPQDATMRNVRAANRKIAQIVQGLNALTYDMISVFGRLDYLENIQRLKKVKSK